jgi:hypothetical protein
MFLKKEKYHFQSTPGMLQSLPTHPFSCLLSRASSKTVTMPRECGRDSSGFTTPPARYLPLHGFSSDSAPFQHVQTPEGWGIDLLKKHTTKIFLLPPLSYLLHYDQKPDRDIFSKAYCCFICFRWTVHIYDGKSSSDRKIAILTETLVVMISTSLIRATLFLIFASCDP